MILRARIVLPIRRPPISDGAVQVDGGRITWVGRWGDCPADQGHEATDLGESILLPGLINAHCHLDYTDMAGHLLPPRRFPDWIKAIVALKSAWSYGDYALSWLHGAKMLLQTGTTTVADVEAVPELLPDVWQATPLRVVSFRELIAVKSHLQAGPLVKTAVAELTALPGAAGRVGLSPHAPYTTSRALLQDAARIALKHDWRLTTHLAESEEEFEMFQHARGPLYDWLKTQRDMSDCGLGSPVRHLERSGYLSGNLLAVHVNFLARGDAALLARRGAHVVHCPRSHEYFRHPPFPRKTLAAAGVNLCLGTDSLASVRKISGHLPRLDMFAEMRILAQKSPELASTTILRMATLNAAEALGRSGELGELSAGAAADLIVIPFDGKPASVEEAAVHHESEVAASMIAGRWAIAPSTGH
jgi:cytosine/adenosine deaminase-related metal-dependent hydrolase